MPNPTKLIFVPPTGSTVDWSPYFMNISTIQRSIESDKPGEAGVIMFDTVTIEMPLSKTGSYFNEELLFGGSAKPKYHVQIKKQISGTDYQLFEGLIDIDSLKFTRHGTVQFDCYDKLSALKFYPTLPARSYDNVLDHIPETEAYFDVVRIADSSQYTFRLYDINEEQVQFNPEWRMFEPGDIMLDPRYYQSVPNDPYSQTKLILIVGHALVSDDYLCIVSVADQQTEALPLKEVFRQDYYDCMFYGEDILLYNGLFLPYAFDAIKMLEAILLSAYPSITIINRTGISSFPISLGFFEQTVNMPFDRPTLEAIKYLASSMRVYVYIDRSGQFIIDKWPGFGSEPSSKPDLSGFQTEDDYRFTWDKLVDRVTIETVAADGSKTEAVSGTEYKNPVNTLERTVFANDDSAQDIADDYFEFYGKRHRARSITRKLDAIVAQLDLTSWVDVGDIDFRDDSDLFYFIEKMGLDVMNDTVNLDLVSVKPFDL